MILVDSSAWIEYLRGTGSATHLSLRDLLAEGDLAVSDPILMEVLAGARDDHHAAQIEGLLGRTQFLPCLPSDFLDAAGLHRRCRKQGETIRRLIDCLIASVAIRTGAAVLHHDRDFDIIGRHSQLTTYPLTHG